MGAWRLEVAPGAPRASDRFLHVLTASDTSVTTAPAAKKVSRDGMDGVTVAVPSPGGAAKEVTVLFNREGAVGGTIIFGNGAPRPFASTVQPQQGLCF
jgi:hypothetical protein